MGKAEKIAALHAMLKLVAGGFVNDEGLPKAKGVELDDDQPFIPTMKDPAAPSLPPSSSSTSYSTHREAMSAPIPLSSAPAGPQYATKVNPTAPATHYSIPLSSNTMQLDQQQSNGVPLQTSFNVQGSSSVLGYGTEHRIDIEVARSYMDFYCKKFRFTRPDLVYKLYQEGGRNIWQAVLQVNGKAVGKGGGNTKKDATTLAYIDSCNWLANCDPALYREFQQETQKQKEKAKKKDQIMTMFPNADIIPVINIKVSEALDNKLRDVIWEARDSELYKKAVKLDAMEKERVRAIHQQRNTSNGGTKGAAGQDGTQGDTTTIILNDYDSQSYANDGRVSQRSLDLKDRLDDYRGDPRQARMRATREGLPVAKHAAELLQMIDQNPVLIVVSGIDRLSVAGEEFPGTVP